LRSQISADSFRARRTRDSPNTQGETINAAHPRVPVRLVSLALVSALMAVGMQLPAIAEAGSPPAAGDPELSVIEGALSDVAGPETQRNQDVEMPGDGGDPVAFEKDGVEFAFGVPGEGEGSLLPDGLTTLYDGEASATSVAVQPVETGARALVLVEDESAPEAFDFEVEGDTARLEANADGTVTAYDAADMPIATTRSPWAVDAEGKDVPTRFQVDGTTLRQVVDHRDGNWAYPITADPVWAVVIAAAARACAGGALAGVASTVLVDIYNGRSSSKRTYVENALASCLVGPVGALAWRVLPGATKRWLVRQTLYFVIHVIRRVR